MNATDFDQIIQSRFAGQSGWFCLGTIDGDPDLEKMKQEWYLLPRQRAELAERCAELAARGFNLYWAACLFGQRQRSYAAALPSPWLWQDDCPADMACTELIQSSEHKYQALVKLDRPITARERQRLQVAWRDATPGADSCSGNAVQLGRMPGGYNRKRHAFFLVHVASRTNKFRSADRLLAKAPALVEKACGIITQLDSPAVALHLANIDALLASGRAKCIKPDTQSGRILAGERVAIASAKLGRMDDSSSTQVAILASGFYCRGFMDEEIAAVGMHFYQEWGVEARKGTEWCKADIARCIALAHAHKPGVVQSPTRYRQQAAGITIVSRPAASRARADRPTKFDPAMLFARYQAQPELCSQRRKARASALGISTATLDRLEDGLEAIGLIEIEAKPGMPGRVILMGGVINIPSPEVLSAPIEAPAQNTPIEQAQSGESADRSPQCKGETHPRPRPPSPPAAPPATLRIGIRRAIRAIEQDSLDPGTGEVKKLARATPDRIRAWLNAAYPEMDTTDIEAEYPEVRKALQAKRTQERNRAFWDGERAKARALEGVPLLAALMGCSSRMQAAERKRPGSPWSKRCAAIFAIYDDERRRRGLSLTDAPAPARDLASRKAARARVANVADVLNRPAQRPEHTAPSQLGFNDLQWLRPAEVDQEDSAGCVPPNPAPAGAAPSGIVERLHALKAQRQQVQP